MEIHPFGYIPDDPDPRDFWYSIRGETDLAPLKASVDLRCRSIAIYDQEGMNTAVACAVAAALQISPHKRPYAPSRLFIYHNARKEIDALTSDDGCSIRDALKSLVRYGVCDEEKWQYLPALLNRKPGPYAYAGAVKPAIKSYERLPFDLALIKTVLSEGIPVLCGSMMYESYDSQETECSGNIPMPSANEDPIGEHCYLLVGYDDGLDEFTVRNSRGPAWGWLGHGRIPYDYVTLEATDLWILHCDK